MGVILGPTVCPICFLFCALALYVFFWGIGNRDLPRRTKSMLGLDSIWFLLYLNCICLLYSLVLSFICILLVSYLHCTCMRWSCHYRQSKPMGFPPTRSRFTHCTDTDLLDFSFLIFCTSPSESFLWKPCVPLPWIWDKMYNQSLCMSQLAYMWKICHGVVICSENNMK